jgi:hypothetical protein
VRSRRVADVSGVDRLAQHARDRRREREVHLGDVRRQDIRRVRRPLLGRPPSKLVEVDRIEDRARRRHAT